MEAAGRNNVLVQALLSRGINVAVTRKHGAGDSKGGAGNDASMAAMGVGAGGYYGGVAGGFGYGHGHGYGPAASRSSSSAGGQGPTAVSGNFIHAKRRGVVNGVDFLYTGDVVSVDVNAVRLRLAQGDVVLLSSLGFNAAGEVLNCQCYDVAVSVAIDIMADKLISYVAPEAMPVSAGGGRMRYLPLSLAEDYIVNLGAANKAARGGGIGGGGGGGGGGGVGRGRGGAGDGSKEKVRKAISSQDDEGAAAAGTEAAAAAEKEAADGSVLEVHHSESSRDENAEAADGVSGDTRPNGAWSEATMEAVEGPSSQRTPPRPPPSGGENADWMLSSWRWLKEPNLWDASGSRGGAGGDGRRQSQPGVGDGWPGASGGASLGSNWPEAGNSSPWWVFVFGGIDACPCSLRLSLEFRKELTHSEHSSSLSRGVLKARRPTQRTNASQPSNCEPTRSRRTGPVCLER